MITIKQRTTKQSGAVYDVYDNDKLIIAAMSPRLIKLYYGVIV